MRKWLRAPGRSLDITKPGWLFIGLTLSVGFVAINSGSNLLHIVFGCQLGMILASGILSEIMLNRAKATFRSTGPLEAKQRGRIEIEIQNLHPRLALLAVSIEQDEDRDSAGKFAPVFVFGLTAGEQRVLSTTMVMPLRGMHEIPPAVLVTRFPFGLFEKRKIIPKQPKILVHPARISPSNPRNQEVEPDRRSESVPLKTFQYEDRSGDFLGLKEYRPGDDLRRIHWPASARFSKTMIRSFSQPSHTTLNLKLDRGVIGEASFERSVERIAADATELLRRGASVGLVYDSHEVLSAASGKGQQYRYLDFLALVGDDVR